MRSNALASLLVCVAACGPSNSSNGGACKDSLIAGDLVITEVFANYKAPVGGSGVDDGKEWFEIYNASDRPIELEGLRVAHGRPDDTTPKVHVMSSVTIAPGQYFVLGNSLDDLLPAYVDYGYGPDLGDLFNTDQGKIALSCGDTEIDSAIYEMVKEGKSRELTSSTFPDYILNDDLANWCEAADTEFEAVNLGTPGAENDCAPVVMGVCNDNGTMRPTVPPQPGELVITEVMPSPTGDDALQEWFEVKALADVDLNGLGLDRAGDTSAPNLVDSPDCIHLAAGSYAVFAKNADAAMNGGLPPVAGTFKFSMVGGSMASPGDVQVLSGANVIDAVSWTSSRTGASLSLDPRLEDAAANDIQSNYCDGVASYGDGTGGKGTPGMVNPQCVLLPPDGQCSDGGQNRAIVKPVVGDLVITEYLANAGGTGTDNRKEWLEIKNVGAAAFDLNDLTIKGNSVSNVIKSADCKSIPPMGFALLAHTIDPTQNGNLPEVDATFTTALTSGSVTVLDGANVIDSIPTLSGADGLSRMLDPTKTTSTDNDSDANFCNATAAQQYDDGAELQPPAPNHGTPKAENVCL